MFLWISSHFSPIALLLVQRHQADLIIIKRLILGRAQVQVEPRLSKLGRHKYNAFNRSTDCSQVQVYGRGRK